MNFQESFGKEQISKNRERLLTLEREDKYVFHGSPDIIDRLEPRQAYNENKKTGEMEKDGEPAVFATPHADTAIFRALINRGESVGESRSGFGMDGENPYFSATQNLLDHAKQQTGRVYVLDKRKFDNFEGAQCRSKEALTPIEVIEVTYDDLPKNIQVIEQGN